MFFGVIFKCLKFFKMWILIFFNSNYCIFSDFFSSFVASLHVCFDVYFNFVLLVLWGNFCDFFIFKNIIIITFSIITTVCFLNLFIWGLLTWYFELFEFLVFGCFCVIFYFLKLLKMSLLIFFNSNYNLFSELFYLRSLYMTLKLFAFTFWVILG